MEMLPRFIIGWVVWFALASVSAAGEQPAPGDAVFQEDRLWTIHIKLTRDRWEAMQPTRASRLATLLGVPRVQPPETQPSTQPATQPATLPADEGQRLAPSPFGYEYAYVRATVSLDDRTLEDVAVRFKGNSSYSTAAQMLKRPFKLNFDKYVDKQEFDGLRTLNLNNAAMDPSMLREALSYWVFKEAGVPTPRAGLGLVYLSVEGLYEKEFLGLYTLVEEADEPSFLKSRFGTSKGMLLKPEGMRNMPYFGDDWRTWTLYQPKGDDLPGDAQRIMEFVRLIHYADDAAFAERIDSYLDTDEFLRFVAVNAVISNLDSFLGVHNYYMYLHPEDRKLRFVPWDLNLALGSAGGSRSGEEAPNLSIERPWREPNALLERLMSVEKYRKAYLEHVRAVSQRAFDEQRVLERLDRMQRAVAKAEEAARAQGKDPVSLTIPRLGNRYVPELKPFVIARAASVREQLAGTRKGWLPGGTSATTRPAKVDRWSARMQPELVQLRVAAATAAAHLLSNGDEDRSGYLSWGEASHLIALFFVATDGEKKGALDEEEIEAGLEHMALLLTARQFVEAPAATQPADRPAAFWAATVVKHADANADQQVTLTEVLAMAQKRFNESNRNNDGTLNRQELTEALEKLLGVEPAPPPVRRR